MDESWRISHTGRARMFGLLDRSGLEKGDDGMSRGSEVGNCWTEVMSRSRGMLGRTMMSVRSGGSQW